MIINALIDIVIGLVIWKLVPQWITFGTGRTRSTFRTLCNIIGVVIVLYGGFQILMLLKRF